MVDRRPEWRDSCRHDLPAARRSKTPANPRGHRITVAAASLPPALAHVTSVPRHRISRRHGPQIADAAGIPGTGTTGNGYSAPYVKYSYRGGQVVHYKLTGGDYGLRVGGSTVYADEARQIVAAFLLQ